MGLRGLGGQGEYRTRRRSGFLRKRVWWRAIQRLCASLPALHWRSIFDSLTPSMTIKLSTDSGGTRRSARYL